MNWFFSALVGAATGVLSGFGVGGGTLLLLWLTLAQDMGQLQAGGVNLLYFICCALPALWGHLRRGLVEKQAVLGCVLAGAARLRRRGVPGRLAGCDPAAPAVRRVSFDCGLAGAVFQKERRQNRGGQNA